MNDRTARHRALSRRLLSAMKISSIAGVFAVGCGGKVFVDPEGGGGSGGSSSSSSSSSGIPGCDYSPSSGQKLVQGCVPMQGDYCPPGEGNQQITDELAKSLGICTFTQADCCGEPMLSAIVCDLGFNGDTCCYAGIVEEGPCIGRPLVIEGEARTAPRRAIAGWSKHAPRAIDLDAATRAALAAAWAEDARHEHASIASFAKLALELMHVGAPSELVRGAERAMGDEITHAELGFSLASAYAGEPIGPGPLAMDGLALASSLAELASAAAREGCVGETISALIAAEAHARAIDPEVRASLAIIAEDEARHAELSWAIVAWAHAHGDDRARAAIAASFDASLAAPPSTTAGADGADRAAMEAHGRLSPSVMREVAAAAMRDVVRPAAASLLGRVGRA